MDITLVLINLNLFSAFMVLSFVLKRSLIPFPK